MAASIDSRHFGCRAVASLALAALVLAGACSQDEGEPCQIDSDCAEGLECRGASNNERGKCVSKDAENEMNDAGIPPDVPPGDAGDDAAVDAVDAGDAGDVVDAGSDAGRDAALEAGGGGDDAGADDSDGG